MLLHKEIRGQNTLLTDYANTAKKNNSYILHPFCKEMRKKCRSYFSPLRFYPPMFRSVENKKQRIRPISKQGLALFFHHLSVHCDSIILQGQEIHACW